MPRDPLNPMDGLHGLSHRALSRGQIGEIAQAIELARAFNREVVRPRALEIEDRIFADPDYLPHDIVREATRRGFYTLWLPKAFGGGGFGPLSMLAFNEELGSECLGIANLIGAHYVGLAVVSATFNFSVLKRLCAEVVGGERTGQPCLVSTAITEPDAGTDMEDIELIDRGRVQCRAERVPGGYRLNGSKMFISNGHLSSWHVVSAYEDLKRPSENAVVLAVRSSTPGFSLGRIERKLGQSACPASVLSFHDCFVPDAWVCARPDANESPEERRLKARVLSEDVLALSRPGVAALSAGAARGAYREALAYCQGATLGGRPMLEAGWVQAMLAEMLKNVGLSRASYWDAGIRVGALGPFRKMQDPSVFLLLKMMPGWLARSVLGPLLASSSAARDLRRDRRALHENGVDSVYAGSSSIAKVAASDLAMENCMLALQLMGAAGLRRENRVEKILRDSKLLQIYEGTNQLNRINAFHRLAARPDDAVFAEPTS